MEKEIIVWVCSCSYCDSHAVNAKVTYEDGLWSVFMHGGRLAYGQELKDAMAWIRSWTSDEYKKEYYNK